MRKKKKTGYRSGAMVRQEQSEFELISVLAQRFIMLKQNNYTPTNLSEYIDPLIQSIQNFFPKYLIIFNTYSIPELHKYLKVFELYPDLPTTFFTYNGEPISSAYITMKRVMDEAINNFCSYLHNTTFNEETFNTILALDLYYITSHTTEDFINYPIVLQTYIDFFSKDKPINTISILNLQNPSYGRSTINNNILKTLMLNMLKCKLLTVD
jgi:hypothetical protein